MTGSQRFARYGPLQLGPRLHPQWGLRALTIGAGSLPFLSLVSRQRSQPRPRGRYGYLDNLLSGQQH
jgi:hypothetical protein